jgi:integrase
MQIALNAAKAITFKQCAEGYIKAHRAGWRDAKHLQQWQNTIAAYAEPIIGALPVGDIDTPLVLKVLEPIWTSRPETASRLRGRIERILDFAKVRGYRAGENPARWRGHLDHLLPHYRKVKKVKHHAALPYAEAPAFITELHTRDGDLQRAHDRHAFFGDNTAIDPAQTAVAAAFDRLILAEFSLNRSHE